jgi:hypothetical protein
MPPRFVKRIRATNWSRLCRYITRSPIAAHLTRYHGVFAPASRDRARIVPGTRSAASTERGEVSVSDRQRAMSWAQRLRRVFAIDIETCQLVWFVTDGQTQGNGWSTGYRFVDPPPQ